MTEANKTPAFVVGDRVQKGDKRFAAWPSIPAGTHGVVTCIDEYVYVEFRIDWPFLPNELIHDTASKEK